MVCAPLGLEQGIALLNQAGELGLDVQWVSGSRWSQDELVRQTGVNCEGVVLPSAYPLRRDEAFETWANTNLPSQSSWTWAAMGHDCCDFLLDAIQQAGPRTAAPSPKPSSGSAGQTACATPPPWISAAGWAGTVWAVSL